MTSSRSSVMWALTLCLALTLCFGTLAVGSPPTLGTSGHNVVFPSFTEERCVALPTLTCSVLPTNGSATTGIVYLTPTWVAASSACHTLITASISNLPKSSEHGFHIHSYGDLSVNDGSSTGGHFTNPAGDALPHGLPEDAERHWGDLGNLPADASGNANYSRVDDVIRLGGVIGRGITIHTDSDKGVSEQPTGGAGSRIGFCVIGYANPDLIVS